MAKNIDNQTMRKELLHFNITVNDEFTFEKNNIVISKMLKGFTYIFSISGFKLKLNNLLTPR